MWQTLNYTRELSSDEHRLAVQGRQPTRMEEKWQILHKTETGEIDFRRSWTGRPVFRARLTEDNSRWSISEGEVFVEIEEDADAPAVEQLGEDFALVVEHALLRKPALSQGDLDFGDPASLKLWSLLGSDIFAPPHEL